MSSDRGARAEELLQQAGSLPAAERDAFLDRECEGDAELRREVEELLPFLSDEGEGDSFLRSPLPRPDGLDAATALKSTEVPPPDDEPAERIGPYRLLEQLGEGGMGEVWLAEQSEPVRRKVALKVIKQGMDTRQVVARFEAEKQALALMDHPAIAKVHDAGVTPRGRPYFVMEYVQGVAITEYCDRHRLTNRERLELFMQVCEGVQHAHQKAVIHRDLKPSNVMVSVRDGRPVPKIIDFGVAKATAQKLTAQTIHTQLGVMIGTPAYMSPEQADLTGENIDTRTDVYALGVLLYELLVGALPFDAKEFHEAGLEAMVRKIREDEPPKPSTRLTTLGDYSTDSARNRRTELPILKRDLSGDLDWITMKALEKDRARRYDSPLDLAADLDRYLTDQPVLASPPSAAYRAKKFVRRHTWGVAAGALGVAAVIAFAATMAVQAGRIAAERDRAQQAQADLESVVTFQSGMLSATDPEQMGRRLMEDLSEHVAELSRSAGNSEAQVASAMAMHRTLVDGVNATDLALNLIDKDILTAAVNTLEEEFGEQPLVDARLRRTIGSTYLRLGLDEHAEEQLERAVEILKRSVGDTHPSTLEATGLLGWTYVARERYEDAERLFAETLARQRRVLGHDHPSTLVSLNSMANCYRNQGRLEEAEPLFVEALQIQKSVIGEDHATVLGTMVNLGALYVQLRRFDDAEPLLVRATEGHGRVLGGDHSSTLVSRFALGNLYRLAERYDDAAAQLGATLEAQQRTLGADHRLTRNTMTALSHVYEMQGRYDEADRLYAVQDRVAIELDAGSIEPFVGRYEMADGSVVTVSREENRLFTQWPAQPRYRAYPESESTFFARVDDWQVGFVRGEDGTVAELIHHQAGSEIRAVRVD